LNSEEEQEKIAVAVFKEGAALFDSRITTSSVISVTIGAKHFDQLLEPVKIWFRRDVRKQPGNYLVSLNDVSLFKPTSMLKHNCYKRL
jgi:hypothetical protein